MKDILERLSFQVKDLQEGFSTLSNAASLKEIVKQFCHILRANLLTTNISLFYKNKDSKQWENLYVSSFATSEALQSLSGNELHLKFNNNSNIKIEAVLPLANHSCFALLIGQKLNKEEYTEFEKILLQIYLQVLGNSYQAYSNRLKEKELIFSLNQRVLQLNSLIDTGIEISRFEKADILWELSLERAAAITNASAAKLTVSKSGEVVDTKIFPEYRTDLLDVKDNIIESEFEFNDYKYQLTLIEKESRKGIAPFDDTDKLLLDSIAQQVNVALENDFLHQEAIEKENIKRELSVASSIQQMIIPKELPEIPGYDIAGVNIPSKEVGGDYYDCMKLKDGSFALIIADVTGKGIPAALLVSTLNASLGAYLDSQFPIDELASKLNSIIYKASPSDKFITFFIGILKPETGELHVVNAGHNPSLLLRKDDSLYKIDAGGVALGMFDMGLPFANETLTIEEGERLLLFTDGIPEAMNEDEEEYSDEKLDDFFMNCKPDASQNFVDEIVKDVKGFAGTAPQSDDLTCLYLIRR